MQVLVQRTWKFFIPILYGELLLRAVWDSSWRSRWLLNIFILAVTHASLQNWGYMDIIREAADPKCSYHLVNSIRTIDDILCNSPSFLKHQLKNLFGLGDLEHDDDFASVLEVSYYLSYTICLVYIYITISYRAHSEHGRPKSGILKLAVPLSTSSVNLWINGWCPSAEWALKIWNYPSDILRGWSHSDKTLHLIWR